MTLFCGAYPAPPPGSSYYLNLNRLLQVLQLRSVYTALASGFFFIVTSANGLKVKAGHGSQHTGQGGATLRNL